MVEERLKIVIQEMNFRKEVSGSWASDPSIYVKVIMGTQEFKTKTVYGRAAHPRFDEEFDLGAGKVESIIVQAWDEGTFSDSFIGECTIFMDQLKVGKGIRNGYTVLKDIKTIGNLFIESVYTGGEEMPAEEEEKPAEDNSAIQPTQQPGMMNISQAQGYSQPQPGMQPFQMAQGYG